MDNNQDHDRDTVVRSLWNAIFSGTRLRHIGDGQREYVLRSIIWDRQESKVVDTETGQVLRFPWAELEFLEPVAENLPGWPAPKIV